MDLIIEKLDLILLLCASMKEMLTRKEALQLLGISNGTFYKRLRPRIRRYSLPGSNKGYFAWSEIVEVIKRNPEPGCEYIRRLI